MAIPSGRGVEVAGLVHRHVCDRGTTIQRNDGATIFRVGERPRAVYAIVSGQIRIEHPTESGGRLVVEKKGPGELLGEYGPLDGADRSADAIAEGPVELVQLPSEAFLELLHDTPETAVQLARTLTIQLRTALARHHDRASVDITTRLARRLADLADRFGEPVEDGLSISTSQADLAGWIGSTREATARSIGRLRDAGVIRTARRAVVVLDAAALDEIGRSGLATEVDA